MNKITKLLSLITVLTLGVLLSVAFISAQDDDDMASTAETIIESIWNEGDMEVVGEYISEDVVVYLPPSLGVEPPFAGHEGYMMNVGGWQAGLPDLNIEIGAVIDGEEASAVRVIITGTHTENFFGIPATGAELAFGANIIYIYDEDGLVVEEWWEWDTVLELIQLGLFTPPGAEGQ